MFTRHWYDRDSVGDALFQAAGAWRDPLRKQKLLFWTYELLLSEEEDYLWGILERVAWRWGNATTVTALQSPNPLHFLHVLLSLPAPPPYDPPVASVAASAVEVPCEVNPAVPEKPAAWSSHQRTRLWLAVQNARSLGRSLRLLRLLGALAPAVAAEYLQVAWDGKRGIYHMLEMVGCPVLPTSTPAPEWPKLALGRVAARLFSVPRSALANGPLDPRNGCAFWRRIWSTQPEETVWNTYFADDLPDEWPVGELAKSHTQPQSQPKH
jgi:hypothetical protein